MPQKKPLEGLSEEEKHKVEELMQTFPERYRRFLSLQSITEEKDIESLIGSLSEEEFELLRDGEIFESIFAKATLRYPDFLEIYRIMVLHGCSMQKAYGECPKTKGKLPPDKRTFNGYLTEAYCVFSKEVSKKRDDHYVISDKFEIGREYISYENDKYLIKTFMKQVINKKNWAYDEWLKCEIYNKENDNKISIIDFFEEEKSNYKDFFKHLPFKERQYFKYVVSEVRNIKVLFPELNSSKENLICRELFEEKEDQVYFSDFAKSVLLAAHPNDNKTQEYALNNKSVISLYKYFTWLVDERVVTASVRHDRYLEYLNSIANNGVIPQIEIKKYYYHFFVEGRFSKSYVPKRDQWGQRLLRKTEIEAFNYKMQVKEMISDVYVNAYRYLMCPECLMFFLITARYLPVPLEESWKHITPVAEYTEQITTYDGNKFCRGAESSN